MTKRNNKFIQDNIAVVIWRCTYPMIGAVLALFAYDLLESSLLALSSTDTLAALGFTLPITTAMTALAVGTSISCNNKAVKTACLDKNKLNRTITTSLIISSIVILFFTLLALAFGQNILELLGYNNWQSTGLSDHKRIVIEQQSTYLTVRYLGWFFLALIWQINAVFRALGFIRLAGILMLSWLAVKSVLIIIFLTPESFFYQEGLLGVAFTHGISDVLFAFVSIYMLKRKIDIQFPSLFDITTAFAKPKLDVCLVVFQQLITPLSMAVLTAIAASIDYSYVAAFALLFRMEAIFLILPMVLTTSMPAIIGTNYWSGHYERVNKAYYFIFSTIIITQFIIAIILFYFSDFLSALVCPQGAVADHIKNYLNWVPFGYFGAGCAIVYQSCLNAKGKVANATVVAVMHRIVLLLPLSFFGGGMENEVGFFQGLMLGHFGAGLYLFYLFKKINSKSAKSAKSAKSEQRNDFSEAEVNLLKSEEHYEYK